jgi:HSP20 family protein
MAQFNFNELEDKINELGDDIQEFVGRVFNKSGKQEGFCPELDVLKDEERITLYMDLPGMKKSEVVISHRNQVLSISGNRKSLHDSGKEILKQERRTGSFSRSFALPAGVNSADIKASFSQGVLTVTVPLKEDAAESNTISID